MWLPSPASAADFLKEPWTPKESLSREVACSECGRVSGYTVRDVRWGMSDDPSVGQELFTCWCIETLCNELRCELPIGFHWLTGGQRGPEEIRFLTLRLFERRFFKNLLCGRGHPPGIRVPTVRRVG
jgi:hypothetical protein